METHNLFFSGQQNEYTRHPVFNQPVEHGLHLTLHEMVRPPLPLTERLGELVLSKVLNSNLDMPVDRLEALGDVIRFLDTLSRTDSAAAQEAEELANNLTFQYRFLQ